MRNKNYSVYSVRDELVYCKLYRVPSSEVNLRRRNAVFFYLFAFLYLDRLGYYTLLTGKFTVVAKVRSAAILRVEPASQPNHVRFIDL
jgi:hypothetical protein